MYLLKMAIRNIRRNRRRSFLAGLSVFLSILLLVVLQSLMSGFMGSIVRNYTKNETGHIRITSEGFVKRGQFLPVDETMPRAREIVAALKADPGLAKGISVITERVSFGVLLTNQGKSKSSLALAGDLEAEKSLIMLNKSVLPEGKYPEASGQTIIGEGAAKTLGLDVGDALKVLTQGSDGSPRMKKFSITGIFRTGVNTLDDAVFQMSLSDAKSLLRMGDSAQQVLVMLKDWRKSDEIAAKIRLLLAKKGLMEGIAVTPWTLIGDYPRLVKMVDSLYIWIDLVVAILGAVIITNVMMMVILERKKEIGIMKSMGVSKREILSLVLIEGTILGFIGSAFGTACGGLLTFILSRKGLDFTDKMSSLNFPMDNVVYPSVDFGSMILLFTLGIAVSAFVSLAPSRKAANMHAVDAIKSA